MTSLDTPSSGPYAIIVPSSGRIYTVAYQEMLTQDHARLRDAQDRTWEECVTWGERGDVICYEYAPGRPANWNWYDADRGHLMHVRVGDVPTGMYTRGNVDDFLEGKPTTRIYTYDRGCLAHQVLLAEMAMMRDGEETQP